jgi:hypothetical protein
MLIAAGFIGQFTGRTSGCDENSMPAPVDQMKAAPTGGDQRSLGIAVVTCPRCGHVDRMTVDSYAGWPDGIRCGLCGPPYVVMDVAITQ